MTNYQKRLRDQWILLGMFAAFLAALPAIVFLLGALDALAI